MITEDYVSYETAKLMKEKGFDEGCSFIVNTITKGVMPVSWPTTNSDIEDEKACLIALPTLQMAMKWLREVHNIVITTDYANICGLGFTYAASVIKINNSGKIEEGDWLNVCLYKNSYEQVCEAAIKYCLENLI